MKKCTITLKELKQLPKELRSLNSIEKQSCAFCLDETSYNVTSILHQTNNTMNTKELISSGYNRLLVIDNKKAVCYQLRKE